MVVLKTKEERIRTFKTIGGFVISTGTPQDPLGGSFIMASSSNPWTYSFTKLEYATVFSNRDLCEMIKKEIERREEWGKEHVYIDPKDHYLKVRLNSLGE